jgi:hypothetical protein
VIIEVLSSTGGSPNRKLKGVVQEFVSKSLTLVTGEEIPVSAEVMVQSRDLLSLGEVLSSILETGSGWSTVVRVKRSLLVV